MNRMIPIGNLLSSKSFVTLSKLHAVAEFMVNDFRLEEDICTSDLEKFGWNRKALY